MNTKRWLCLVRFSALIFFALLVFLTNTPATLATPPHGSNSNLTVPGWSGWTSMGRPSGIPEAGAPVVGTDLDGRLELFVDAPGAEFGFRGIYWKYQTQPDGPWSDWGHFGDDNYMADPAVTANWDGRLNVFVSRDLHIYERYQPLPNDGWSDWSSIAGSTVGLYRPVAARNQDGRLACAYGVAGYVTVKEQTGAGVDNWANNLPPDHPATAGLSPLAIVPNMDGRLEIFAQGSDGHVYNSWQTVPNGGWSATWGDLSAPALPFAYGPVVGQNADGRLEVFGADTGGTVWHRWQWGFLGQWSEWTSLGKPDGVNLNYTQVARLLSGRLVVLSVGDDGALWAIQQTPALSAWESWFTLGKPSITFFRANSLFQGITSAQNSDGYLSIFAVGDDGAVWKLDQLRTTDLPVILGPNY